MPGMKSKRHSLDDIQRKKIRKIRFPIWVLFRKASHKKDMQDALPGNGQITQTEKKTIHFQCYLPFICARSAGQPFLRKIRAVSIPSGCSIKISRKIRSNGSLHAKSSLPLKLDHQNHPLYF